MKVNKRILTMLIGTLMIGSMAVGCEKKEDKVEETQTQQQTQVEEKKEPVKKEVNKVVYDKNDIKITCIEIEGDNVYMPVVTMKFKIENNRDEAVTVQNDTEVRIDGKEISGSLVEDFEAKETREVVMTIFDEIDLEEDGIEKFETNLMILHNEYRILDEEVLTFNISE